MTGQFCIQLFSIEIKRKLSFSLLTRFFFRADNYRRFWYRKTFEIGIKFWRLPPPAFVTSSPPSSRPQAVAPRPLWRLPPPASVTSSPPSSRPQAVAPRPLWRLPPPDTNPYSLVFVIFSQGLLRFSPILSFRNF